MSSEGRVRWVAAGGSGIVPLGDTWVFRKARVEVQGLRGAPDMVAEFEILDGVPECTSIRWETKPGGRGIRTSDLHVIKVDGLTTNAFLKHAIVRRAHRSSPPRDEREHWAAVGDLGDAIATRNRGANRDELEQVAEIYREHLGGAPTAAVEKLLGYSRRTAARRVRQARDAGLLPETEAGRKKA
jgi:hypothetical protein